MPVYFSGAIAMTTFQVSVTANPDDIDGSFRTSLRYSDNYVPPRKRASSKTRERSSSASRTLSTTTTTTNISTQNDDSLLGLRSSQSFTRSPGSVRDSAFESSQNSYRSSSFTSGPSRNNDGRLSQRRPKSSTPAVAGATRSRSRPGSRAGAVANGGGGRLDYDATLYDNAPLVTRFNQTGELYQPVSHAWQAFKERLFDSSLSEKYETLQVDNTPYNNRRYRSISPRGFDDEFDDDDDDDPYHTEDSPNSRKRLLFLQDPLARSMYRNLETFFDRKNLIRDFTSAGGGGDYITSGGAPGGLTSRSSNHHNQSHFTSSAQDYQPMESRAQSSMDFRSSSAMGMNSTARSLDPPRSQSSMDNRGGGSTSGSFFGRRKREQPVSARAHSVERRPEDARKEIQQRFAKINFEEGTTDYDALFTVSEERGDLSSGPEAAAQRRGLGMIGVGLEPEHHGDHHSHQHHDHQGTPKAKLDHLRY